MFGYGTREVSNPEILKYGSHLSFLSHFRSLFMLMFGHRNSRSSEPRNPEMRDPPFLFRLFMLIFTGKFVYVDLFGCLDTGTREVPNPEIPKCGSHLSFFSHFRSLFMLMFGHLNSRSSEPRNPEMRVPPFPFSHFRKFVYVDVWTPNSRSSEPRNPEMRVPFPFFTFRKLLCVDVWALVLAKSRTPEIPKMSLWIRIKSYLLLNSKLKRN
jgi:hypothetical protein